MTTPVDIKKLQKWIGKAKSIDEPAGGDASASQRVVRRHDPIVQLNLKIPGSLKRRMKLLAARDDVNLMTLLARMVDEYERAHGALPEITNSAR